MPARTSRTRLAVIAVAATLVQAAAPAVRGASAAAGGHFLGLSDLSAAQGWAAQVLARFGPAVRRGTARDSDVRLSLAFERLGRWEWTRVEAGPRWALAGGPGLYARGGPGRSYGAAVSATIARTASSAGSRLPA